MRLKESFYSSSKCATKKTASPNGNRAQRRTIDSRWQCLSHSPQRLLFLTGVWIFFAEFLDMMLLAILPELSTLAEAIVDSTFLLIIASPIYFFLYRPFLAHWTAKKQMEEDLRKSEELYRSLVENIDFGITLIDSDHKIIMSNRSQERFFDQPAGALVGKRCYSALHGLTRVCPSCPARETTRTGQPASTELTYRRDDGSPWYIRLSTFPVFAQDGLIEGVIEVTEDITDSKRAEEEIRFLSQQLIRSAEEERKRLARDLHDEFGQVLTTLQLGMETLKESLPEMLSVQRQQCGKLSGHIALLGDRVRDISTRLRPSILDDYGLIEALQWLVQQFASEMEHLDIDFQIEGQSDRRYPIDIEIALYRICQEALNNVAKHAHARHVVVRLSVRRLAVFLSVRDDGQGFEFEKVKEEERGIGLLGIRERLAPLGGSLTIISPDAGGTDLRVEVPLTQERGEDGQHQSSDRR